MENCNTGAGEPMDHYGGKGSSAYSTSGEIPSKALRDQRRQWYAHLEELSALKDDWNEEGGYAIVPELIELVRDGMPNKSLLDMTTAQPILDAESLIRFVPAHSMSRNGTIGSGVFTLRRLPSGEDEDYVSLMRKDY